MATTGTDAEISSALRAFRGGELNDPEVSVFAVLDSFEVVNLIAYLEEEFGIAIGLEEVTHDNFGRLDALVAFIRRKRVSS